MAYVDLEEYSEKKACKGNIKHYRPAAGSLRRKYQKLHTCNNLLINIAYKNC